MTVSRRFGLIGESLGLFLLAIAGALLLALVSVAAVLSVFWIGIPLTLGALALLRSFADLHRSWATGIGVEIPRPYRPAAEGGPVRRLVAHASDPATWRDMAWVLLDGTVGAAILAVPAGLALTTVWYLALPILWQLVPDGLFASDLSLPMSIDSYSHTLTKGLPIAAVCAALCWWWTPACMRAYARLARSVLAPSISQRLAARVSDLTETRNQTVDAQAAELRRIERDLHDGPQARLAGVGLSIGMAEESLTRDPEKVPQLLAEARESAGVAMAELRALVRGIHPPALADRGLAGGLRALALASSREVGLVIELPGRPPAAVESAVYFTVAELLANATKHSDADQISVMVHHAGGRLVAAVTDNGRGGAIARPGSGLDGVARRLAAFDGSLDIDSPPGGPTTMTITVPCVLS